MEKININRMQPIRDVVYHRLRKAILCGDYAPGARLMEEPLSQILGTSRTPVREALRKLEVEKMVRHHPHKGVVVTDINIDEREDLYEIRTLTEAIIARRAALNATPEDIDRLYALLDKEAAATDPDVISDCIDQYNYAIADVANCPQIADIANKLRETLIRMIVMTNLKPKRRPDAQKEHREIVAAIASGDSELAQRLTVQHVRNASFMLQTPEE